METQACLSPAGLDRPSRVSAYHVAIEAVEYGLSGGDASDHVAFLIVSGMREALSLDASEEDFDAAYAKLRAVVRTPGTLSIPFKTAIDTVDRREGLEYAYTKALSLYVELIYESNYEDARRTTDEVHMLATNCGPVGLPDDVEPSSNRFDLGDRLWQRIVRTSADQPKKKKKRRGQK